MPKMQKVTIETISNGAAIERANLELDNVIKNLMDPNTSQKVVRKVILTITIKPSDDRTLGVVDIQAVSKLAPIAEHQTQVYIGKDEFGKPEISELVQPELSFGKNITPIKKEGTN